MLLNSFKGESVKKNTRLKKAENKFFIPRTILNILKKYTWEKGSKIIN